MSAMRPEIPEFEIPARENPDWASARTPRAAVLVPSAEWVQSVFTCEFDLDGRHFLTPNRDYPYEGLLVHSHGENWKFIDAMAISVSTPDGVPLKLRHDDPATCVRVTPFQATYWYMFEEVIVDEVSVAPRLYVTYALDSPPQPGSVTGRVTVGVANPWPGMASHLEVAIQPFLDVRHMFGAADPDKCSFETTDDPEPAAWVRAYNRSITFHFPEGELTRFRGPERLSWWYKLGTGQRAEVPGWDGRLAPEFQGERKEVAAFFRFQPVLDEATPSVTIRFTCRLQEEPEPVFDEPDYASLEAASGERHAKLWCRGWEMAGGEWADEQRLAVAGRIAGVANLRIFASPAGSEQVLSVPPAGGWWFSTPWFRDMFEGLLSSFQTLMKLEGERDVIPAAVDLAVGFQDRASGLVPNRVPEFNDSRPAYDGSDATLLCLITGLRYALETGDRGFAHRILLACVRAINRFRKAFGSPMVPGGGPRLMPETGLLLTCPRHSWIDTKNQEVWYAGHRMQGLPNRASATFVEDLYESLGDARHVEWILSTPSFFMPELNAQWLLVLSLMLDLLQKFRPPLPAAGNPLYALLPDLIDRARHAYLEVFWNEDAGFLYNLVFEDRSVRDSVDCEAAVVAAGMLGSTLFSLRQLEAIWKHVEARLLVRRRLVRLGDEWLPFGVLAMRLGKRIFYGDPEYHADTVWLRSTPHLIQLLRALGKQKEAKEAALNALDHQMSEGAIFYNQELLALPFGNNPAPDERTRRNPVPVKNPLQFWSQWCDGMWP